MKNFRINFFNLKLKYWANLIILWTIIFFGSVNTTNAEKGISPQLIDEAQILVERQAQLFNARQTTDWEKIHGLQHPNFRNKISVEEVRYFEGWTTYDYRERAKQKAHISGAAVPALEYIKKHPHKFDPLGFPVARRYIWSGDPFLKIQTYSLEKISISENGKYAKVTIMAKGKQRLNPVVVRGHFEFDAQYPLTDYWEKIDGTWVITLLSAPVSMSGSGVLKYYLPNDNSAWENINFVEITPEKLNLS